MLGPNATRDMIEKEILDCSKRIGEWSQMVEDFQDQITKLNRWIAFEQGDVDMAVEMLGEIKGDYKTIPYLCNHSAISHIPEYKLNGVVCPDCGLKFERGNQR